MPQHPRFEAFTLNSLRNRCAQESERFFKRQKHDPRFCFEIFRRAIVNDDQRCWDCVYSQYQPLVTGWVERHALFAASGEEAQYFVNRAFEKMWTVMTPEKFGRFPDLKSLLRYLQMCVHSVLVDYLRNREEASLLEDEVEEPANLSHPEEDSPEEKVFQQVQAEKLWQMLEERFKNQKERRVIYGSFVLALKPGEIYRQYPQEFQAVGEVYQVKENILARLKRDQELFDFINQVNV